MQVEFDKWEQTTFVCALIAYALQVAHPEECIRLLNKVMPEPKRPWEEIVSEARDSHRAIFDRAEEAAPTREP